MQETKLIRVTKPDYDRITFMKGYLSITKFITSLLDKEEQPKQKASRPNPKLKDKKVHPLFASFKFIYEQQWIANNNFAYHWNGAVDATALNRLIKTLESIDEKNQGIEDLFRLIMDKLPTFYHDKTINAINKNINGIIADIKNGGNKGSKLHQDGGIYDFRK